MNVLTDKTIYIVIKHWDDGGALSQEENIITTEQGALDSVKQGGHGESFEVVAFNPVEGWSQDVSEDIANLCDDCFYENSLITYEPFKDEEFSCDDSAYEAQVANQILEAAE